MLHGRRPFRAAFSVVGREPLGRFAPSPTGPLHLGSLLAATGSYLDARTAGGRWLVRIEDLDTPRVVPGCADQMLRVLDSFGFEWDGEVVYQSTRREAYREALARLDSMGRLFRCSCSRKELAGDVPDAPYPGTCRGGAARPGPTSLRFRVDDAPIHFDDLFLGPQHGVAPGDVVVQRRDGIASYQLAVVVDDAWQSVTRVVRGADLLSSTAWQIGIQRALGLSTPIYGHLPLLTEPDGTKLSKSRRALPLDPTEAPRALFTALTHLSQAPPPELAFTSVKEVWAWAFANWNPQALAGKTESRLSAASDRNADSEL
jgi:glutamyl-Q tRNA(Asp) synthetase